MTRRLPATASALLLCLAPAVHAQPQPQADDRATVAALDRAYQAAVKANDAPAMARILADDFVLVLGNGTTYGKEDLLREAREHNRQYEQQDELAQTVRVWRDTAVVTARLWLKGTNRDGSRFDYKLWFSDTYVRTPDGWRYVLGQASLRLPE
ncbi:nuclear transport factor 2 family protein [Lysobacter yangpyeongensis]|uniref:Nuclear transport factor 2 family protein n=1 Tax=Lysobacter yangpyeongensis TaxID=346182 RepID=A0ABW0SRY9_9GAMM